MARKSTKHVPPVEKKGPVPLKTTMTKSLASYTDPAALRTLMQNAKRLGRDDIWRDAFRRLCSLEGESQSEPLLRDFHGTLAAYEQLLSEKNGRATRASRTRMKLKAKGAIQCLEDWATSKDATEEFELLVANSLPEMTGEQLVVNYADQFKPEAVEAAKARLATIEVAPGAA